VAVKGNGVGSGSSNLPSNKSTNKSRQADQEPRTVYRRWIVVVTAVTFKWIEINKRNNKAIQQQSERSQQQQLNERTKFTPYRP
jgi:hypothetical protein